MKLYNYLFYKTFILAKHSKNFEDSPVLGGLIFVAACLMFNIFTVFGIMDTLGVAVGIDFKREYKYILSLSVVVFLLVYYLHKDRYKRIVDKYEQCNNGIKVHPIIVIMIYYTISFGLLLLVGLYKNKDWIFA